MKVVGILGGAFDPIHVDHINLAKRVLDLKIVDQVLIIPCYKHKFGKDMASFEQRMEMVNIACVEAKKEGYNISGSDVEMKMDHDGSSYDLLTKYLKPAFRILDKKCKFIIGVDNANGISKWHEWKQLLFEVDFVVVNRGEYKALGKEWYFNAPHQYVNSDVGTVSSSFVRESIKEGKPITGTLLPSVEQYIRLNKLYETRIP